MAILTKAIMQCFPVVLFIIPVKVVLTFDLLDKLLNCDHSVEQNFRGAVYCTVEGGSNFKVCR